MVDMSNSDALKICEMMNEAGARDIRGLALGPECSWASFLLIGTATSRVHMYGVAGAVRDLMKELGNDPSGGRKSGDDRWHIIDGGDIVVSLMDKEAREFYALEERWYEAEVIFTGGDSQSSISS